MQIAISHEIPLPLLVRRTHGLFIKKGSPLCSPPSCLFRFRQPNKPLQTFHHQSLCFTLTSVVHSLHTHTNSQYLLSHELSFFDLFSTPFTHFFHPKPVNSSKTRQNAFHDLCCWPGRPCACRCWTARPRAVHRLQHRDGDCHLLRRYRHRLPGSLHWVSAPILG